MGTVHALWLGLLQCHPCARLRATQCWARPSWGVHRVAHPICAPPPPRSVLLGQACRLGPWSHPWVRHMAVPEAHMLAGDPASLLASLGSHDWECPCRVSRPSIPLSAVTRLLPQATISPHPKHTLHILHTHTHAHTHTHTFFFDLKQCHPCLGHFQRNLASSPRNSRNSLLWPHLGGPKYCLFLLLHHWSTLWAQGQVYAEGLHVVQPNWYPVGLQWIPAETTSQARVAAQSVWITGSLPH